MNNRNQLYSAVRRALAAGVVASVVSPMVLAQGEAGDEDVYRGQKVETTGSRIKRAQVEGPNPLTVIRREDLDETGEISVADVLRQTTFNSFGSFREASGFTAQSQASISLRGVGSQRTLVLVDGRRIAGSGNAAGGQIQNLNVIPFAAVERIEILRDGASAVYGSDAIGGVINIILRKDYEGLHVAAQVERPTQAGGDGNSGSITGGVTSGRGNITFSVDHQERQIIFDRERSFSSVGLSFFGYPGTYIREGGTIPDPATGLYYTADPRCPSTLGGSAQFPNSVRTPTSGVCYFNFAAISASAASLRRDSLFVSSNFELSDSVNFFARFTTSHNESFGRYAPAPVTGPLPTMAAANPNNPTIGEPGGPYDITIAFRAVPVGPRDSTAYDDLFDVLVGLNGTQDWFGGLEWELGLQHSRAHISTPGSNYGIRVFLQQAIDNGSFNPFGVLDDNVIAGIRHTIYQDAESRDVGFDFTVNFDLFQMPNGPVPLALGVEYWDEQFFLHNDAQSDALNVFGTAGGSADGQRARNAVFAEVLVPIVDILEVDLALRHDHYNDFGESTNPKVGVALRPTDSLLIRANWGKGFRAPDLSILNAAQAQSFPSSIDSLSCFLAGSTGSACVVTQFETLFGGNPNLLPELSEQWTAGVVWNPTEDITLSADHYNIDLTQQIANVTTQQVLNNELLAFQQGRALNGATEGSVIRNPNGSIRLVLAPALNIGKLQTQGWDFEASWNFEVGNWGDFRAWAVASWVQEYNLQSIAGAPFQDYAGTIGAPDKRVNGGIDWSRGDFSGAIQVNYIDKTTASGPGAPFPGSIPSWTTWDFQLGWATPWDGKVTVGVRNVADRDPPISSAFGHPNWSFFNYDIFGRVPYIRYEQDL